MQSSQESEQLENLNGLSINNENINVNDQAELPVRYDTDYYHSVMNITRDGEIVELVRIHNIIEPQFEIIKINGVTLRMEIDSGSSISAISLECYRKNFSNLPIQSNETMFKTYNNQPIYMVK